MSVVFDFSGKVVLVTGAGRGVGRVTAAAFADAGALVLAADRDAPGLAGTVAPHPGRMIAAQADISTAEGAGEVVSRAVREFGRLDICVNNAAVAPHTSLLEERVEVWDRVYAVNCRGTFLVTQASARAMIERGAGGRIINFSSGVSSRGSAGAAAYASSRAATESFTRVAAIELAHHGILVNCVSPGLIDTQPKPLPPAMASSLSARIPRLPLARPGLPEEVAAMVLWLSSEAASYVSGAVFSVDGAAGVGSRSEDLIVDDDIRYDWVTGRQRPG